MNLKNIAISTKQVLVPFEGLKGFEVMLSAVSREVSKNLRKESEITKINSQLRVPETILDEEMFLEKFAAHAIKGWKGLTYRHLSSLMLIDEAQVEDWEAEVPYSTENAHILLKASPTFDAWVNSKVFDIETFRSEPKS